MKDVGGLTPLPTWMGTLWKSVLPGLLALTILLFGVNYLILPDFTKVNREEKDINLLIKENPIITNGHISSKTRVPTIELPQAGTSALKELESVTHNNKVDYLVYLLLTSLFLILLGNYLLLLKQEIYLRYQKN